MAMMASSVLFCSVQHGDRPRRPAIVASCNADDSSDLYAVAQGGLSMVAAGGNGTGQQIIAVLQSFRHSPVSAARRFS
jgi:hypothetical protein